MFGNFLETVSGVLVFRFHSLQWRSSSSGTVRRYGALARRSLAGSRCSGWARHDGRDQVEVARLITSRSRRFVLWRLDSPGTALSVLVELSGLGLVKVALDQL